MTISRQREWQLKMKKEGRCISCGIKTKNNYCKIHAAKKYAQEQKWRRKNKEKVKEYNKKFYKYIPRNT